MKSPISRSKCNYLYVALLMALSISACQKEISKKAPETVELESPDPANSNFTIVSDNITETGSGYKFDGKLGTESGNGTAYAIGDGHFEVVTAADGSVASIKGDGMVEFPKVGLFAEILKTFAWKFIKAHIEYEKGSYYVQQYKTDIPLDPDRRYLHYKVFDETKDGDFELRHIANQVLYSFNDLYIDPLDPAVLFKVQLKKPSSPQVPSPANIASGFWANVKSKLAAFGGPVISYVSGPKLMVGISNNANFKSQSYAFKVSDPDAFKEKFGFNSFESLPSHYFFRISGIPIPSTGILRIAGEATIHSPVKSLVPPVTPTNEMRENLSAVLDWINNEEQNGYMATYTGSIDPGGKGIGAILGLLPNVNKLLGKEIFSDDLDIDLVGGTLQYQVPGINQIGSGQVPSFLRFGLEIKKPLIANIFGDNIKKYLISLPSPSNYFYFSLGPTTDEMNFYTEATAKMVVPAFGDLELGRAIFYIDKNGVSLNSSRNINIGPLHLETSLKGNISPEGFNLKALINNNITLPGDIQLTAKRLDLEIDSKEGISLQGDATLPLGLGEASVSGKLTDKGLTLSGSLHAGTQLDLGNGLQLPTANMKFTYSSDPAIGFQVEGDLQVPFVGSVSVKGKFSKNDFLLTGKANTAQIVLGSATLPYANGAISISKSNGIVFNGLFDLGAFGKTNLQGAISSTNISLNGSFTANVRIAGHDFNFSNGKVTADKSGVKINGNIDLYFYKFSVSGNFYSASNFNLQGQYSYDGTFVKTTISATVTPSKITLTGSGKVYGALGNELYSGSLLFEPDWNARTVRACYTLLGSSYCLTL
jgi:hypothetical protein